MQIDAPLAPDVAYAIDQCGAGLLDRPDVQRFIANLEALAPDQRQKFAEALDVHQIPSKLWLLDALRPYCDLAAARLVVLGAWYGILPLLANWRLATPPARMTCVDIDRAACELGQRVIGSVYPNVEYACADVMELDYARLAGEPGTVIINTICEHLPRFAAWRDRLPAGQLVVLQSNNYFACPDHVNAVPSLAVFAQQARLREVLVEDTLPLPLMQRYMLIGRG